MTQEKNCKNHKNLKNPFSMITRLPVLDFRYRRFIFIVQRKEVISMISYSSVTMNEA